EVEAKRNRCMSCGIFSCKDLCDATLIMATEIRGLTSWEWACYTGRSESAFIMQKLMDRPCPEQFCDQYKPEWPKMKELLAKAAEPKSCLQRISECMRSAVSFRAYHGPEEDGVLDHMVRVTTSLGSPFIALSCRTVCPGSPPSVGKRRLAVQEILRKQRSGPPGCAGRRAWHGLGGIFSASEPQRKQSGLVFRCSGNLQPPPPHLFL
uniref:Ankyrin repeat domain 33B n=1 Tax=Dromaius novaehollandiae TaxID=8790 RepID=A0A8C4KQG3_DRONO